MIASYQVLVYFYYSIISLFVFISCCIALRTPSNFTKRKSALDNAKFNLQKQTANNKKIQKLIAEQNQDNSKKPQKCLQKVPGITWNIETDKCIQDTWNIERHKFIEDFGNIIEICIYLLSTKRNILRTQGICYNPPYLISSVTSPIKCIL